MKNMINYAEEVRKLAECERRLARAEKKYAETGNEMWKTIADDQKLFIAGHKYNIAKVESKISAN